LSTTPREEAGAGDCACCSTRVLARHEAREPSSPACSSSRKHGKASHEEAGSSRQRSSRKQQGLLRKPGACLSVIMSSASAGSGRSPAGGAFRIRSRGHAEYEGKERQDQGPGSSRAIAGREPPHRFSSFSFPSMFQPVEHSCKYSVFFIKSGAVLEGGRWVWDGVSLIWLAVCDTSILVSHTAFNACMHLILPLPSSTQPAANP
jgi:hypothetical protein